MNIQKLIICIISTYLFTSFTFKSYSQEKKLLLKDYQIRIDDKSAKNLQEEAHEFVLQKPNHKLLGFINLRQWLYKITHKKEGEGWIQKIGETIGEEPVYFDRLKTQKSVTQLRQFMQNKGYFEAVVTDSISESKKNIEVIYFIKPQKPCIISQLNFNIADTTIRSLVINSAENALVKVGSKLNVNHLQQERERINNLLKNSGYYDFSTEYISFQADTLGTPYKARLTVSLSNPKGQAHQQYKISKLILFPDFDTKASLADPKAYLADFDTLKLDSVSNIFILTNQKQRIKPITFLRENYLEANDIYQQEKVENTYRQLMSLPALKLVNISFSDDSISNLNFDKYKYLECKLQLTPSVFQSYNLELEGSNTSGNLGFAGNLVYQHKNLFHGAENLYVRFRSAFETQTEGILPSAKKDALFNTYELGSEAGIDFPKFLFPFFSDNFSKKYKLKSNISVIYNFQNRPDFVRTLANVSLGYLWKGTNTNYRYFFNLFNLNLIKVSQETNRFLHVIDSLHIAYSYEDQLISSMNIGLTYDNQNEKGRKRHYFTRLNFETGGLLPGLYAETFPENSTSSQKKLFSMKYAQYFKTDFEYRHYRQFVSKNKLVYRFLAGIAIPYGNSVKGLPFVKKYYAGGSNSLRAWPVRSLGPGTYKNTAHIFNNQTGDIRLEGNIEYRTPLFWILEAALFLDAGNIWAFNKYDEREGAKFSSNFYKEIAVGTGIGIRFDFTYFIARLDFGLKLKDPSESLRWIFTQRAFKRADIAANIGIGYPF
jgi:outer membrane protein assembly factor BamA